jgi:DNA polymerase III delta subunit
MPFRIQVSSDPLLIEEQFTREFKAAKESDDETIVIDLAEAESFQQLLISLLQPAIFAPRIRILAKNFQVLQSSDYQQLLDTVEETRSQTDLVAFFKGNKVPKRLADSADEIRQLEVSKKQQKQAYLREAAAEHKVRLTPDAEALVIESLGADIAKVHRLMEIVSLAFPKGTVLTSDDLESYLAMQGEIPLYYLTGAIEQGNTVEALEILDRLLGLDKPYPLILSVIENRMLEIIALASNALSSIEQAKSVLSRAGLEKKSDYSVKTALASSRKLDYQSCKWIIEWLAKTEYDLRGGSLIEPCFALEILVGRLSAIFGRKPFVTR